MADPVDPAVDLLELTDPFEKCPADKGDMAKKTIRTIPQERTPMREQDPRCARKTSPKSTAVIGSKTHYVKPSAA